MVDINGDPWFVAQDVCVAVGSDPRRIDNFLKYTPKRDKMLSPYKLEGVGGRQREMLLVSESGMYGTLLRAQRTRPEVVEFQDWVTRVVLPAIRKDGGIFHCKFLSGWSDLHYVAFPPLPPPFRQKRPDLKFPLQNELLRFGLPLRSRTRCLSRMD